MPYDFSISGDGFPVRFFFSILKSVLLYILLVRLLIVGIFGFLINVLVSLEATTKSKLASLNEKLDTLERRLEMLEVQVSTASANSSLFTT